MLVLALVLLAASLKPRETTAYRAYAPTPSPTFTGSVTRIAGAIPPPPPPPRADDDVGGSIPGGVAGVVAGGGVGATGAASGDAAGAISELDVVVGAGVGSSRTRLEYSGGGGFSGGAAGGGGGVASATPTASASSLDIIVSSVLCARRGATRARLSIWGAGWRYREAK